MSYFKPERYVKALPKDPLVTQINYDFTFRSRVLPAVLPILSVLILVTQVIYPLISFTTQEETAKTASQSALGYVTGFQEFEFEELKNSNVLGTSTFPKDIKGNVPEYFEITIPKLGIENALVETNDESLSPDDALGHYKGSSLPGEVGNTFIYGHSVLPWFFNPHNYKTIFSTLDRLEEGDTFYIKYNNRRYTYKVEGKRELKPELVQPLEAIKPAYLNESTVVLMTCSPAGTKLKRLLVDAVLID